MVKIEEKLKDSFSGKKIFLTGHTGFKGAWFLKVLNHFGAIVKGYSLSPDEVSMYKLIKGDTLCDSVIGDIRDSEKLKKEITNFDPDFVFHFAAQPLVRESYDKPIYTFETNIIGTANLLNSIRYCNKKVTIVIITTDKVYHNNEWVYPYREDDRLGGIDPYSASKSCAEIVTNSFAKSFFNINEYQHHKKAVATARAGNVIGGGDWAKDRIIPDIIRSFFSNQVVSVRNPSSVRPWQHVLEPLFGYLILAQNLSESPHIYSSEFNFGPNSHDVLSVGNLVQIVLEKLESLKYEFSSEANQKHEATLLKLDISKANEILGWKPRLNARTAIFDTIDWYKAYYESKEDISHFTSTQIAHYLKVL